MAEHAHVTPQTVTAETGASQPRARKTGIRRSMVAHPFAVFLGTLPFLALNIVARSLEAVGTGPAALWNVLAVVGWLGSVGVWVFLLARLFFRRPAEREFVRWRKEVSREHAAAYQRHRVVQAIVCPTCQVAGAVQRSSGVGQFVCGRCGFTW